MRITESILKERIGELNVLRGYPASAFDDETGRWTKGAYEVKSVEDGYRVVKLKTVTTGATEGMSPGALTSAREVLAWIEGAIHAMKIEL